VADEKDNVMRKTTLRRLSSMLLLVASAAAASVAQQPLRWGKQNIHQFSYSTDGKHYTPAGQPFSMHNGHWKGAHVGLYAYNTTESQGGKVQTDYFRYNILE
jgi:hypothetical protein